MCPGLAPGLPQRRRGALSGGGLRNCWSSPGLEEFPECQVRTHFLGAPQMWPSFHGLGEKSLTELFLCKVTSHIIPYSFNAEEFHL